jgi:hypothetical protein
MNRRFFVLSLVLLLAFAGAGIVSAQSFSSGFGSMPSNAGTYGQWKSSSGRLFQNDVIQPLAKINFRAPQSGEMEYTFNVRYEGGGMEDRRAGFGLQVFADRVNPGRSWGNGDSYLLWLNYDENATYGGKGFRGQVYKSRNHFSMSLLEGFDVPLDDSVLTEDNLRVIVPVKIRVNGATGEVKIWDPTAENRYYSFMLDRAPGTGSYIALRSNSMAVSFDDLVVRKIR